MITSENVVTEEQFKSIYITWKTKIPFFLTYLTFCILNHSTNLGHDGEYIFEYIFSMVNHLVMKLGQLLDIDMGDIFKNFLHYLEDWVLHPDPFQFNNLPQSIKKQ